MKDYRSHFSEDESARYDQESYAARSHSSLLWEIEQVALSGLLDNASFVCRRDAYLDFACGTGRITRFIATRFSQSTGLDISPAMLARAREQAPDITFVQCNVIDEPTGVQDSFDLITAFRFILNANQHDRVPALRWMRGRLRDESSRIVLNNHGNLWSHKALSRGRRILLGSRGRSVSGNVLSHRQALGLFGNAGLAVEKRLGCGVLPGRAISLLGYNRMLNVERRAAVAGSIGVDQIYVLRPI